MSSGSRPMGNIRKHFSEYVQQIVEESIDKKEDGKLQ
jgi:glucose-6-phosphate isomerase